MTDSSLPRWPAEPALFLDLAGIHGLERRNAQGARAEPGRDNDAVESIRGRLQDLAERYPETSLEDKGTALALHYRRCPDLEGLLTDCPIRTP